MKTKLGLLYGGKSAEHQVSLRTALAVIGALDHEKFDIYPIYIKETGEWIRGPQLEGEVQSVEDLRFSQADSCNRVTTAIFCLIPNRRWKSFT